MKKMAFGTNGLKPVKNGMLKNLATSLSPPTILSSRPHPLCCRVGHQRRDEERDGGMVRAGRDEGQGDRAGADPGALPGPRPRRLRHRQCHTQQTTKGELTEGHMLEGGDISNVYPHTL